jgi:hypothetical protein
MSVILTGQFDRSENISAANKLAILQQSEQRAPRLSHAYATVFVVAVVLVALTFIPAALLPKKPSASTPNEV